MRVPLRNMAGQTVGSGARTFFAAPVNEAGAQLSCDKRATPLDCADQDPFRGDGSGRKPGDKRARGAQAGSIRAPSEGGGMSLSPTAQLLPTHARKMRAWPALGLRSALRKRLIVPGRLQMMRRGPRRWWPCWGACGRRLGLNPALARPGRSEVGQQPAPRQNTAH